ncbi:MAG: ROK family protein [Clostridiales bacterium]|jgi:predicted NBD/HSP70 family sugar kinase|nr:ROK family protein [Clostridiales bacterium]HOB63919.1 ROK family protein [Clostridia bacterium]HOK81874.1 ROK family protein [Clostridia bacterium]HOL60893.1 ROK family protein [Clostridia bacterium]HPO53601.1 ROK family protein [Clostridia bacterium]
MIPDKGYMPMYLWYKGFREGVLASSAKPFFLALEREDGGIKSFRLRIYSDPLMGDDNFFICERIAKFMLWAYGGFRFYVFGDRYIYEKLKGAYSETGERAFDYNFMRKVFKRPLEFVYVENSQDFPADVGHAIRPKAQAEGYRIGFDAGGSDRKVTACIDGKAVFEDETVWNPKLNSDPSYHEQGIWESIDKALAALGGRVDSIGVSTAGIVINNEVRVASLFRLVPEGLFEQRIVPIYKNLAERYGCPVTVANDGDVAALAGAYQTGRGELLGTAMGTSLAGGYIDKDMGISGYLNELAFVPVDANPDAAADEWSGDRGVGCMYHSQDGVIKLANELGIDFSSCNTPAEKLKVVQKLAESGDERAESIFLRMGDYYGYSILWFAEFYSIKNVIFLGRVASGRGGELILGRANEILKQYESEIKIILPDEMSRRLGQSYTAACL